MGQKMHKNYLNHILDPNMFECGTLYLVEVYSNIASCTFYHAFENCLFYRGMDSGIDSLLHSWL